MKNPKKNEEREREREREKREGSRFEKKKVKKREDFFSSSTSVFSFSVFFAPRGREEKSILSLLAPALLLPLLVPTRRPRGHLALVVGWA